MARKSCWGHKVGGVGVGGVECAWVVFRDHEIRGNQCKHNKLSKRLVCGLRYSLEASYLVPNSSAMVQNPC